MTDFPNGWDPESPGSRFTARVALALLGGRSGKSRFSHGDDTGSASDVAADVLDADLLASTSVLGEPKAIDGSVGRGAAGWVPVIEFVAVAAIGGVLGNAAWAGVKAAGSQARALVASMKEADVRILVSRGTAALLAIAWILEVGDEFEVLDVEAVAEPSALAGRPPTELSYVGVEPWLVALVNADRSSRYVVAVGSDGEILSWMKMPMGQMESFYSTLRRVE
jgi:hypothetical protein